MVLVWNAKGCSQFSDWKQTHLNPSQQWKLKTRCLRLWTNVCLTSLWSWVWTPYPNQSGGDLVKEYSLSSHFIIWLILKYKKYCLQYAIQTRLFMWKFVQSLPSSLQSARMASVQDTAALMACFASSASFFLRYPNPFRAEWVEPMDLRHRSTRYKPRGFLK